MALKSLGFVVSGLLWISAAAWAGPSYGELARTRVDAAWGPFTDSLPVLKPNVMPHEPKDLRKKIVALREQLDLFVYAFPFSKSRDSWADIRDLLDDGYELIGEFKDLYDVQHVESPAQAHYDERELREKRELVLAWFGTWRRAQAANRVYLSRPSRDHLYDRPKKDLSKFYWGAAKIEPKLKWDGLQNLARLTDNLLELAQDDYRAVRDIKNPATSHDLEEQFHDFRKRLRSVARVIRTTPGLYLGPDESIQQVEDLVEAYGDINDKIIAHRKADARGDAKASEGLVREIGVMWLELRQRQETLGVRLLLEQIRNQLSL